LACFMGITAAGAEPQAILHVLPSEESLGQQWKREVSLLFDPLSKPAVITPETSTLPESFKNEQLDTVANPQSHVSGWGNAQYTLHLTNGPAVYDVQIYRYRDRLRLAEEFDQLLRLDSEQYQHSPVKGLGDAAVFYRSTRTPGSTLWFRRADFKAWIAPSSSVTRWEEDVNLQNLATQLDQRMVQRTGDSAVPVGSVAPTHSELGVGWGERRVVYAIDPLEQPTERVNPQASEDPTNRAAIVRTVRDALARNGSVAMAELDYAHVTHNFPVTLTLSRYPDVASLESYWGRLRDKVDDTKPVSTAVGQSAAWLQTAQAEADPPAARVLVRTRILVFRQGLFTGWVEGVAELGEQPLLDLAKATVDRMALTR
jgi:hypothetical protein